MLGTSLTPRCHVDDNLRVVPQGSFPRSGSQYLVPRQTVSAVQLPPSTPLRHRTRQATADELRRMPWWPQLDALECERVAADLRVADAEVGEVLCRIGRPATLWFGVVDGLLKMSNDSAMGAPITFTGVPPGAGSAKARCSSARPIATTSRPCAAASSPACRRHLPLAARTQHRVQPLRDEPAQRAPRPVHRRARDRPHDRPRHRAWRAAWPRCSTRSLYPGVGELLRITQQELGYLVGPVAPARERGAAHPADARLIRIEYGGVRVLDLPGLQRSRP